MLNNLFRFANHWILLKVRKVAFGIFFDEILKIEFVPQKASDATEALAELRALLRTVGHELHRSAEVFVVLRKPLDQKVAFLDFDADHDAFRESVGFFGVFRAQIDDFLFGFVCDFLFLF